MDGPNGDVCQVCGDPHRDRQLYRCAVCRAVCCGYQAVQPPPKKGKLNKPPHHLIGLTPCGPLIPAA